MGCWLIKNTGVLVNEIYGCIGSGRSVVLVRGIRDLVNRVNGILANEMQEMGCNIQRIHY